MRLGGGNLGRDRYGHAAGGKRFSQHHYQCLGPADARAMMFRAGEPRRKIANER